MSPPIDEFDSLCAGATGGIRLGRLGFTSSYLPAEATGEFHAHSLLLPPGLFLGGKEHIS
jgi:hypothetical protein